jgi:hypothetical protein
LIDYRITKGTDLFVGQLTLQVAQAPVTVLVGLFLEKPVIERFLFAGFVLLLGGRFGTAAQCQAD